MVKEINIIRRIGSKQNDIKHFKHLLPLDCKTIVEPFGGSFAVSKFFYTDINKYNFHINDKDDDLFYVYKNYKLYLDVLPDLFKCVSNGETKDSFTRYKEYMNNLDIDDRIKTYITNNYVIRGVIVKLTIGNYCKAEYDILDNATITNDDYTTLFEQYKDNDFEARVPLDGFEYMKEMEDKVNKEMRGEDRWDRGRVKRLEKRRRGIGEHAQREASGVSIEQQVEDSEEERIERRDCKELSKPRSISEEGVSGTRRCIRRQQPSTFI